MFIIQATGVKRAKTKKATSTTLDFGSLSFSPYVLISSFSLPNVASILGIESGRQL
jgi:hypothetical protein